VAAVTRAVRVGLWALFGAFFLFPLYAMADFSTRDLLHGGRTTAAWTNLFADDALYTVTEIYPDHVVLDGNHPLAGLALRLALVVRDVREASDDEIEAGSVGSPGISVLGAAQPGPHLH